MARPSLAPLVALRSLITPLGPMQLATDSEGRVIALDFGGRAPAAARLRGRDYRVSFSDTAPGADPAAAQLAEYFAGERRDFVLPLAPAGTLFQQRVWRQLQRVPYGETVSYGEIAARLGQPGAAQAVGGANGKNPIAIIIPCHRVVAADGGIGGYSSGLHRKRALLRLEEAAGGGPKR